jgi:hypothetical protein
VEARTGSRRSAELRELIASAIRRGPGAVLPACLLVLLGAAAAAVLILTVVPGDTPLTTLQHWVRVGCGGLAALAGVGFLAYLFRSGGRDRAPTESDPALTAGLLAIAALALLALIPVYLLAASTRPPTEEWIGYGFFDKRWLVASFMLGTLGAMLVVAAASRLVQAAATAPDSWRAWGRAAFPLGGSPVAGISALGLSRAGLVAGIAAAFAMAAYFYAPPWNVALSDIDIHETPMMAGVQAIGNGAIPYIGAAAVQYGPGSELFQYLYLEASGWNVVSLRESTVLIYWLAATIFFVTLFLRLPWRLALVASLISVLLFPTLQMVSFQPDGSVDAAIDRTRGAEPGVWGWPNAMRYIGVFMLAMLFPAVAAMERRRGLIAGVALGVVWGFTCYFSQENLIGGIIVLGVLALLLGLTGTVPFRALATALGRLALGFAAVAAIVFGYYAAQGELLRFLELYYLIPPAVAAGYSNTVFYLGFDGPWGRMYHLLPFLLAALCLAALLRLHPLRVARAWSPERVLLVSALVAACVAHAGSLLRADSSHLINTMLALPVALTLAVAYLPRLLAIQSRRRGALAAAALVIVTLALMPLSQLRDVGHRATWPLARFDYESPALAWQRAPSDSVAAQRLTPDVLSRPGQWCCTYFRYPTTMRELADILNRLHAVVGDRRTYVANFIDELQPGGAYFLADLEPAPIYFEPQTMAMNERLLDDFLAHFREHADEIEAVVAVFPNLPEVRMFRRAHPDYRQIELPYRYGAITVLVSDGGGRTTAQTPGPPGRPAAPARAGRS